MSQADAAAYLHKHHAVTPRMFSRYIAGTATPPAALVALLWYECGDGIDTASDHAHEGKVLAMRHAASLSHTLDLARAEIAQLEADIQALKASANDSMPLAANERRFSRL